MSLVGATSVKLEKTHHVWKLVFVIKWLNDMGECEDTKLRKIGGFHEAWNESHPFCDAGQVCAGNVNFWPQRPFEAIIPVTEEGAAYFAIETRVHSH